MCDAWGLLFCSFAFMDEEEEKKKLCNIEIPGKKPTDHKAPEH